MNSSFMRRIVNEATKTLEEAQIEFEKEKQNLKNAEDCTTYCREALEIAQKKALEIQNQTYLYVEQIVNRCLEAALDDPYQFHLQFIQQRGKTEVNLTFSRNGVIVNPVYAAGGGVVDIASFALRLACLILHTPALSKIMILDEPFKFVSADIRQRIATLLEELSKEIGIQIIMVSHLEELKIGKIHVIE